jgi:hypothetical protein
MNESFSAYKLTVGLLIYGFTCSPEEITALLKINPTETFLKGQPVRKGALNTHHYNGWWLESGVAPDESSWQEHMDAIFEVIGEKIDHFDLLPSESEIELSCGLVWRNQNIRPGIYVSPQALKILARIGCSIDISLF